jgi:hypothetical protein
MTDRSDPAPSWFDVEPALIGAGRAIFLRLVQRASASWPFWVAASVVLAAGLTVLRGRRPSQYEVTVVLRVTEGALQSPGAELGNAMLRARVNELAFTNSRLLEVMARYPQAFGDVSGDPAAAAEKFRSLIAVSITENDFIEDRLLGDPPRAARIALTVQARKPDLAYSLAHEVAELVISSTVTRQRTAIAQAQVAAVSAVTTAEASADRARNAAPAASPSRVDPRIERAQQRLLAAAQQAEATELAERSAETQQSIRFEMIDPGRKPSPPGKEAAVAAAVGTLLGTLLVVCLFVGAFDPRVLDLVDLARAGVAPLGELPPLPGARVGGESAVQSRGGDRPGTRV